MPTLMRQINVISRCGGRFRTEKLKEFGLCAPHHSYILNICNHPGISQEQLAEHICVDKSNVTRQLAYLENEGYVERKQSETDRRVTLVYPTEKAFRALVGELVSQGEGKLTLVPADDKRVEFASADADFSDLTSDLTGGDD